MARPPAVTREEVLAFMRRHSLASVSTLSPTGSPQAAVVGFVVTDAFEIVFDTLESTRKARNLAAHPVAALVVGGFNPGDQQTVQYEGVTDTPRDTELAPLVERYLTVFPDGVARQSWPGLIYIRVRPRWLRYSDYRATPPLIAEFSFP